MHAFDRQTDGLTDGQTDGQTEISSQDRVCIPCSAVKTIIGSKEQLLRECSMTYFPALPLATNPGDITDSIRLNTPTVTKYFAR